MNITVEVSKREDLLQAFAKNKGSTYSRAVGENVEIRFENTPHMTYIVPMVDLIYYACQLPPKGKLMDKYALKKEDLCLE